MEVGDQAAGVDRGAGGESLERARARRAIACSVSSSAGAARGGGEDRVGGDRALERHAGAGRSCGRR